MGGVADGLSLPPYRFFLGACGAFGRPLLLGEVVLVLVVRAVLFLPRMAGPAIGTPWLRHPVSIVSPVLPIGFLPFC